jgi:hypothetical protein
MVASVDPIQVAQLSGDFLAERDSVALYEALAALERDVSQQTAYLQLAIARRERAESLQAHLRSAGAPVPRIRISRRIRLFAMLLRFLSGGFVIPIFTTSALDEHRADHSLGLRRADSERS